jgi:hypothetical protein
MAKRGTKKSILAYSKRPLWYWVMIYLVAGAIVYGLYYYIMMSNGGYGAPTYTQSNSGY